MCGIAAIVALPGEVIAPQFGEMFDRLLKHRGPDASGVAYFRRDCVTCPPEIAELVLVHRRLSIIDLDARSDQPMESADGRYVLVYNGEIYNYLELRAELERLGHVFRTQSDSEVLIAAMAHWGEQALPRFTGMFAFVLLDRERRELFLARDPFGIKPLYWAIGRDVIAMASEITPLLDLPGVGRRADITRTSLYLAVGQTDHGERTMFAGIRSVPAGAYVRISLFQPKGPKVVSYWQPEVTPREQSFADATRELREIFIESVRLHLRSDVPVGISLSGGIDSAAILACARAIGGSKLDICSFSFTAVGSDVDETPYIEIAADAAQANREYVRIEPTEILEDIDGLVRVQAEPFGSLSIYAQHRVMRLAAQRGIKVMLGGQGADELFAGYRPYLGRRLSELIGERKLGDAIRFAGQIRGLPGASAALFAQSLEPASPAFARRWLRRLIGRPAMPCWIDENWFFRRNALASSPNLKWGPDFLRRALRQSLTETVLPALLRYEDRNSMHHAIESRVPFLTPSLARFAGSLPSEYLIGRDATSKAVLRTAMRGLVPDAILDRRDKIGYATPDGLWARTLQSWIGYVLDSEAARSLPWLRVDLALGALEARRSRFAAFGFDVWRTVNLIRWVELFGVKFD